MSGRVKGGKWKWKTEQKQQAFKNNGENFREWTLLFCTGGYGFQGFFLEKIMVRGK